MLSLSTLLLITSLGVALWFWQDSLRTRERAKDACLRACRSYSVQLLDDTVALDKLWLRRDKAGRLCFERRYTFEFSDNNHSRSGGIIIMLGQKIEILALDGGDLFIP